MKTESLYVHIPFCDNICSYCDFAKLYYDRQLVERYLDRLMDELHKRVNNKNLKTIYIGGGTPSALDCNQLERLLLGLDEYAKVVEEYSFEANPESLTSEKIALLKKHRVNRVSLGVQSFNDSIVADLGRVHDREMVFKVVNNLKAAGITNINIDLMYGLKNQIIEDVEKDLAELLALDLPHLSYYSLIIEPHTVISGADYPELDDDSAGAITDLINGFLEKNGYGHYEVSNYARPGSESRHNLAYWLYENYYGVGIGATSKIDDRMIANNRNIHKYIAGENIQEIEVLTKADTMFNHLMMNFRLKKGIDIANFNQRHDVDIFEVYQKAFNEHLECDIFVVDGYLRLSDQAHNNLNGILVDFL